MHNASLTTSAGWKVNPKADPTFVALDIDAQGGKRQRLQKQSDNQEDETEFPDELRRNHHAGNTHDKSKNAESPCFSAWDHGDCPLAIMFTEELENTMITPKMVRMITAVLNP